MNVRKALTCGCIIHIRMQASYARSCRLEAHQVITPYMLSAQLSARAVMPAGTLLESMRQHQHTAAHLVSRRQTRQASTPSCKKPSISCIRAVKSQEGPSLSCCYSIHQKAVCQGTSKKSTRSTLAAGTAHTRQALALPAKARGLLLRPQQQTTRLCTTSKPGEQLEYYVMTPT
jgi:hypothetical protein